MDSQKDVSKTEAVTKFLDYQTLKSSPFGENRVGERLYRKAERIASAVVLLTNHIHVSDELRKGVRQSAIDVLYAITNMRDDMRAVNSVQANDLKMSVRKTISLVRLLGISGYTSLQNAEIVIEALDELLAFLRASRRSVLSESVNMQREDFMDLHDRRPVTDRMDSGEEAAGARQEPGATLSYGRSAGRGVSGRSQAILEVLRQHGEMGIRDVVANLPEYSEKMIQRELAALVEGGQVKKTGLKRWSRYTYIEAPATSGGAVTA